MSSKYQKQKAATSFFHEIHKMMKQDYCILCNKKISSARNSHTVPQFILKNISEKGNVSYGISLSKLDVKGLPKTTGINNAYTFKLLCEKCEHSLFTHYENPDNLLNFEQLNIDIQKTMLSEMALKAHLSHINMKYQTLVVKDSVSEGFVSENEKKGIFTAERIDIIEHFDTIKRLKKANKEKRDPFVLLYTKLLDYKTKIAAQTLICYVYDLHNNCIFDVNDFSLENKCPYFYIMIFPLSDKTRIMFFTEKSNKDSASSVIDDFMKMTDDEKLHFIFISLIVHSEQFYLSPSLAQHISKNDKKLVSLYSKTDRSGWFFLAKDWRSEIKNFKKYSCYLKKED